MRIFARSKLQLSQSGRPVLVCPLTALIDSHIKELKDHAKLANTKIIAAQFAAKKLGNYS